MTEKKLDLDVDDESGEKKTTSTSGGSRGRGRPSNEAKTQDRTSSIREELGELAEWVEKWDGEFGGALKEGAPRMAKVLSARAAKHARIAKAVDVLFAKDGPLAALRAFGPTLRVLGRRLGSLRDRDELYVDADGFLMDPETGLHVLDENGQPIRAGDA